MKIFLVEEFWKKHVALLQSYETINRSVEGNPKGQC